MSDLGLFSLFLFKFDDTACHLHGLRGQQRNGRRRCWAGDNNVTFLWIFVCGLIIKIMLQVIYKTATITGKQRASVINLFL